MQCWIAECTWTPYSVHFGFYTTLKGGRESRRQDYNVSVRYQQCVSDCRYIIYFDFSALIQSNGINTHNMFPHFVFIGNNGITVDVQVEIYRVLVKYKYIILFCTKNLLEPWKSGPKTHRWQRTQSYKQRNETLKFMTTKSVVLFYAPFFDVILVAIPLDALI